jgi:hypothetical protein
LGSPKDQIEAESEFDGFQPGDLVSKVVGRWVEWLHFMLFFAYNTGKCSAL